MPTESDSPAEMKPEVEHSITHHLAEKLLGWRRIEAPGGWKYWTPDPNSREYDSAVDRTTFDPFSCPKDCLIVENAAIREKKLRLAMISDSGGWWSVTAILGNRHFGARRKVRLEALCWAVALATGWMVDDK